jgi:exonuclease SbcC
MQGFTSFAERTEIDLSDLDLFAITGPTGSGKTSILDAITWALYGSTPRLGKCGADLISHGAASVAVHFEFAAGGNRHRVGRTVKLKGSAQVRLEEWRQGDWAPDDATGVRETDNTISELVGLDFDAFTRSVVLPQGQFDAFLRGDHAQRRAILKSLLGLEVYDRMREIAGGRARQLGDKVDAEQAVIDRDYANATEEHLAALTGDLRLQEGLRELNSIDLALADTLCDLGSQMESARSAIDQKVSVKEQAERDLQKARVLADETTAECQRLERDLNAVRLERDAIVIDENRVRDLAALNERASRLADLETQSGISRKDLDSLHGDLVLRRSEQQAVQERSKEAEEARLAADRERNEADARLEAALAGGSADLLASRAESLSQIPALEAKAAAIQQQKEELPRREDELRTQIAAFGQQREAVELALAKARNDEAELAKHEHHRDLRAGLKIGTACPICEQSVTALPKVPKPGELKAARDLINTHERALQTVRDSITRAETELTGLPALLRDLKARAEETVETIARIRETVHAAAGVLDDSTCAESLNANIAAIHSAEHELKAARERATLAEKSARTATRSAADLDRSVAELTARADGLEGELRRVNGEIETVRPGVEQAGGRDQILAELEAVDAARAKRSRLDVKSNELQADLAKARHTADSAGRDAAVLIERVRALAVDIEALEKSVADLNAKWSSNIRNAALPDGETELKQAAQWREQLRQHRTEIDRSVAELETAVVDTKKRIEDLAERKARVNDLGLRRDLYSQLHSALHANRFIDYLLGTAYASLCEHGSAHLLRLSGERYSFKASQKDFLVKDAWNGDAERPAATLSGGESFLASLSLALALAESVASFGTDGAQAVRLDALFIDEGVSTLDQDEALPAVVEALMSLQTGGRMIGVISHMENLAQRLPARIEIVKNRGRSTVRVNGYTSGTGISASAGSSAN